MVLASGPSSNRILNYQLRLTDNNGVPVADGTKNLKLTFYTLSSGGSQLYTACSSDGTATGTPTAVVVTFTSGVATVLIGDTGVTCASGTAVAIPATLFDSTAMYLGVTVNADAEMTPRKRIVAAGYALNADKLDDLDTSNAGGSNAFVPVTDSSGNLTLTKNVTVDTNTFFVDSANHRVGIGTATPSGKLHVQSSALESVGYFRSSNASTSSVLYADNTNAAATPEVVVGNDTGTAYWLFGVGGSTASSTLFGSSTANVAFMQTSGASVTEARIGTPTNVPVIFGQNDTERMRIAAGGNVGIGDTTPAATLTVGSGDLFQVNGANGNVTTSGDVAVNGADLTTTSTGTATLFNTNATTVNVGGAATTVAIGASTGTATIANATVNLSNGVLQTAGTQRMSNAGALSNITGYSQSSGNFAQSGAGTFGTGTGAVSLNGDTSIAAGKAFTLGSNAGDLTGANGMMSYNTSTGKFRCYQGGAWTDCVSTGGGMSIGGTVTSGTAGSILFVNAGPVLAQDNANFFWDDTNNRLGLHTSSPAYTLDVSESTLAGIPARIAKTASPTTTFGNPYLSIGGSEWAGSGIQTIGFGYRTTAAEKSPAEIGFIDTNVSGNTAGALVFATRNTTGSSDIPSERMRIESDGDVAIGATSASSRFVVQGSGASSATSSLNVTNSAAASMLYVRDDGRVGIGTASPTSALLDVKGTVANIGGATLLTLATPGAPSVSPQGTPGATSWSYKITAVNHAGQETDASIVGSTSSGAATLNGTDFNRLTWSAVTGANQYKVYRTVSGGTPSSTGLITTVTAPTLQFDDTGYGGSGTAAPTRNASGDVAIGGTVSASTTKLLVTEPTNATGLTDTVWLTAGGSGGGANIVFSGWWSGSYPTWRLGEVGVQEESSGWNGNLIFKTNSGGGLTDSTEKMR
ncbi:MAG: hypothetical protein RL272_1117, partial [Candidatus Parcubacteria bacterium]